jgi:hypothetical protein
MSPLFRVIWRRRLVEVDLAGFVVTAMERDDDVEDITAAMNEIDRLLGSNPENFGESRDDFERVLIVSPLAIDYEIHQEERIVYVLRARYTPRRPNSE